jgi:hypothetical protein
MAQGGFKSTTMVLINHVTSEVAVWVTVLAVRVKEKWTPTKKCGFELWIFFHGFYFRIQLAPS